MAIIGYYPVYDGDINVFNVPVFEAPSIPPYDPSYGNAAKLSDSAYNSFQVHIFGSDYFPYSPKTLKGPDDKIEVYNDTIYENCFVAPSNRSAREVVGSSEFIIVKLPEEYNSRFVAMEVNPPDETYDTHYIFFAPADYANFDFWPDSLSLVQNPIPDSPIDRIEVEPDKYSLTYGQSKGFHIKAYKGDNEVSGIEFEVGPLPDGARGVRLTYPLGDNYGVAEVKMPYQSDGVIPDITFDIPVKFDDVATTFRVGFSGGSAYTPGTGIGGGAGIPSGSGGGGGSFPTDPGPSLVDRIPTGQTGNDIAQSGLFTMYLMNQQYMNLMGEILWEDNIGIQAAKEIFGNPINTVISTISYPFNLLNLVQYAAQNLYFGQWKTDLIFQALTKSSFQIDWGTISIPFAWGNFLDYAPHTKMELFLPWGPGYVTIDPNEVSPFSNTAGDFNVGGFTAGSIQVKTNVELGKGTCVHNVIGNNGRVIGSYSGIVGKQIPITALDTGGKVLTTVAAVATGSVGLATAAGAMSGKFNTGQMTKHKQIDPLLNRPLYADVGYMQKASEGVSGIDRGANLASSALMSHPITFPRAGTFSDGSSAMTVQTPFLIISRPVQSVPAQYGHYNGYPSNIYYPSFYNISGYTEISEIHLDNVTATADELQELDTIMKGGILL